MSSISAVSSNTMTTQAMGGRHRPDPAKMAAELFSRIDTDSQGYIEESDLQAAFSKIGSSSETSSAADLFSQLDSDGDGKVTKEEFSTVLQSVSNQLDSQFEQMRMSGAMQGMGGMPPPPPPQNDEGFTKDELESQLSEIGTSDSKRSSLISNIVENFDAADTDGDGKVSFKEAMAYDQSNAATASSTSASSTSSTAISDDANQKLMMQIMKLVHGYNLDSKGSSLLSTISASA